MRSVFFALLVFMSSNLFAESTFQKSNGQNNGLGAGGTVFDTWGFVYRQHFTSGFGLTTSLGGWITRNSGYVGNEIGPIFTLKHHEFDWSFLSHASIRVYFVGYLANIYRRGYYSYSNESRSNAWDIGFGAGPGLEFFFNRYFGLHLELPWMTFVRAADSKLAFEKSYPHIGGGLVYYF